MRLKNKVAIVTGGAQGIGQAYAMGFAKEGARVVVADIDFAGAELLAARLVSQGAEAFATRTDVSILDDTREMADKTVERFGRIDILINNAAVFQRNPTVRAPCWEMEPAEFERVMAVNVTGVFLCCRAVLPHMIKEKSGKIVNIASSLAFAGLANFTHYSASKGAVVAFTRAHSKRRPQPHDGGAPSE